MYDLSRNLAVQSYCFRNFKAVPDLIAQIKSLGLTRTELCGVHANFDDEASFAGVIEQFKKAGIQIASIGVQYFRGGPNEEKWFRFAKAAGASMISVSFTVDSTPGSFQSAARLADQYDINLGIHNHGGYDWLGNAGMLEHLMRTLPRRIGLCLDTAWCLQAAGNPVEWAEKFRDRLYGIHIKDFVFDRAGKWSDVIVGTGNLDLPKFLKAALVAPNLTAVTLEFEGKPDIIMIKAPGAKELDGVKEQIAPDGTLNLDLLGRVAIAGKTPKEIEDLLTADLMTYYKDRDAVRVHVDVEYKSQWYYVFGETAASGPKRYTGHDTLVQVLAEAQLTRLAWPERIYLIKPSPDPDQRHVTVINLKEIIQQGDGTANVLLNQDDIVYVPLNPLANVGVGIQNLLFPAQPVFQAAGGAHTLGF